MARLIPVHILAAPPAIDFEAIVPTLYDPEEFAALYHADKERAIALVAAMNESQRVRQALAYAAWLAYHGLEIDLATVLAAWEAG
jgi:dienelactone hydrolase